MGSRRSMEQRVKTPGKKILYARFVWHQLIVQYIMNLRIEATVCCICTQQSSVFSSLLAFRFS